MIAIRQASFLIVDDSATMRSLISGMLRQIGAVHIDVAESGHAALQKLSGADYTVIISDWNMAPVDGQELLKCVVLRRRPRTNRFIFVTSDGSWGRKTTAKIDGADDFIVKPFDVRTLGLKVHRILERAA